MKFELVHLSSAQEKWTDLATAHYLDKISYFTKIEIHDIGSVKSPRNSQSNKVAAESEKILKYIRSDDYVVLFDEHGESLNSLEFSKTIEKILNSGKKRALFVIGGAFGVGLDVKDRANKKISLSPMVFNHLVAQVVALEQIYRGFMIFKNLPYHNK